MKILPTITPKPPKIDPQAHDVDRRLPDGHTPGTRSH
jgi:hypothetical protein